MIAITLDLEWASDPVLREAIELLDEYGIEATLFSTHDDPLSCPEHERAIHPNFTQDKTSDAVLDELCDLYPGAIGLRSHQMYIHTKLRNKFVSRGVEYESNYLCYKVADLVPFWMPEGTVQFPVYWMDDIWFRRDGKEPSIPDLLHESGLKVFDFHPPHVVFNTPSSEYYLDHKDLYWNDDPDVNSIQYSGYGVRDVFVALLEYIDTHSIETYTLEELYTLYLNGSRSDWPDRNLVQ
jgi:hypothetical protein